MYHSGKMASFQFTNEDYENLVLFHGEFDKVLTRTCALFIRRQLVRSSKTQSRYHKENNKKFKRLKHWQFITKCQEIMVTEI